jgi:hypothetical protein
MKDDFDLMAHLQTSIAGILSSKWQELLIKTMTEIRSLVKPREGTFTLISNAPMDHDPGEHWQGKGPAATAPVTPL